MPKKRRKRETYPFMGVDFIGASRSRVRNPKVQPVLPITIWGPHGRRISVECALVDTGADFCTCPSTLTKPVGYKLRTGKHVEFFGAAAKGKAWEHFADISILTPDYKAEFCRISKVPLHLVQKRKYFPVLLGRKGFLDQFEIHIDFPRQLFTLIRL